MKTRILALLMTLALLCCLFAGCAKTEEAAEPVQEAPAAEAPAEEAPAEAAPPAEEAPAEAAPAEEAPPAEEVPEEGEAPAEEPPAAPAFSIQYPLTTGETVTGWFAFFGALDNFIADSDYNNMYIIPFLEEGAGVDLQLKTVSDTVASEQFPLMVASGDWPDYCNSYATMYSGGLLQAYEDECILSMEDDYLAEFAPDYWAIRSQLTGDDLASALENHMNLGVYTIADASNDGQGMVTRKDWFDEQGAHDMTTLDGFTQYLYDCYAAYGGDSILHVEEGGNPGFVDDAFGTMIPAYNGSSVPYFVDEGVVKSSLVADGYYDYVEWFRKLYADKIINGEFYGRSMMTYQRWPAIADGQIAVFACNPGSVYDMNIYVADGQDIEPMPLSYITDEDGVNNWATRMSVVSGCYSVSADTTHPETVLAFLNYMFTEDGAMYGNWGVEGHTYDLDENGEPYYTTLITENEFNTMAENAIRGYIDEVFPVYRDADRLWCTYTGAMLDAAELWMGGEKTYDHVYPEAAGLTTAEQDTITNQSADIMTFVSTEILGFMTGGMELNETTWAEYCATLETMGLNDVLAVYQTAYDEVQAGTR